MTGEPAGRTAARVLVEALAAHGVDRAFGVPGESYLEVLDGLYDTDIEFIVCRQEGGAAMMAAADGRLTGRPGVAMVTRGPGAANASAGLHIAQQDSLPMVMLIGQVGRDMLDREAFQEIDYRRMFGQVCKWVAQIDDPERVPEYVARAFATAVQGRPGPVALALPEDMLRAEVSCRAYAAQIATPPAPTAAAMARLGDLLATAERPFLMLGGPGWTEAARADVGRFAETHGVSVGCTFRAQDLFDNAHPNYAGHVSIGIDPALADHIRRADLLIALGPRLGEITTDGYTLPAAGAPVENLIHVHVNPDELGRVYRPALAINAAATEAAAALAELPQRGPNRAEWVNYGRAIYERYLAVPADASSPMAEIAAHVAAATPDHTVVANGAGNYSIWVHRHTPYRRLGTQLAPTSGSMGFGLPAAIAAARRAKGDRVIAWAGDGCFMMTSQEFATAVQYDLPITVIVVDNQMYGTIRMHQERRHPGRVSGTTLRNPDFAAMATSFGARGYAATDVASFRYAFEAAQSGDGPALIHLIVDPKVLSPSMTLKG